MKKIWILSLFFISIPVCADEPSVQSQCKSGFKEFHLADNSAKFQVCPNSHGSYSVDATAVGGNYHTCWWPLTLSKTNSGFSAAEEDCKLDIVFSEGKLNAQFTGECRHYCGARARFKNGDFIERAPSPRQAKPESPEYQPPQLWTGNKQLDGNIESCARKVGKILNSLGFTNITKSVYPAETYFYANVADNRAGIHCTSINGKTFVYGSVAGTDVKTVESLRNKIFWSF